MLVTVTWRLGVLLIRQPDRKVWSCYACLTFAFIVNNYTESTALKHSDLMWIVVSIIYFQAATIARQLPSRSPSRVPLRYPALARTS